MFRYKKDRVTEEDLEEFIEGLKEEGWNDFEIQDHPEIQRMKYKLGVD